MLKFIIKKLKSVAKLQFINNKYSNNFSKSLIRKQNVILNIKVV